METLLKTSTIKIPPTKPLKRETPFASLLLPPFARTSFEALLNPYST
jgi:hypothetical protein